MSQEFCLNIQYGSGEVGVTNQSKISIHEPVDNAEKTDLCQTESLRDSPHFSSRVLNIDRLHLNNAGHSPMDDD